MISRTRIKESQADESLELRACFARSCRLPIVMGESLIVIELELAHLALSLRGLAHAHTHTHTRARRRRRHYIIGY